MLFLALKGFKALNNRIMADTIIDVISNADKTKYYVFIRTPIMSDHSLPKVVYDLCTHSVKISGSGTPIYKLLHKVYPEAPFDYIVIQKTSCTDFKIDMNVPIPELVPIFNPDNIVAHALCENGVIMLELETCVNTVDVPIMCKNKCASTF